MEARVPVKAHLDRRVDMEVRALSDQRINITHTNQPCRLFMMVGHLKLKLELLSLQSNVETTFIGCVSRHKLIAVYVC